MTYVGVPEALKVVRDILRDNLDDPYELASGKERTWIYKSQDPRRDATFPRINIKKIRNPRDNIGINGFNFTELEECFMRVYFYTKAGFRVSISNTTYKNENLVEYYLGQITRKLKLNQSTLDVNDITGYKAIDTSPVSYEENTGTYIGYAQIRVWWFNTESG